MYGYRTWWLAAFASLAFGSASVQASPISYGFSGTLAQPFDGATTFSGSFTYDTDLPIYPGLGGGYPGWSYYSGVPADPSEPVLSLTFNVGNLSSASLLPVEMDDLVVSHTQLSDSFDIQETLSYAKGQNLTATFGMSSNNLVEHTVQFNRSTAQLESRGLLGSEFFTRGDDRGRPTVERDRNRYVAGTIE